MIEAQKQKISGLFLLQLQAHRDDRGYFARSFCREEFKKLGLCTEFPQDNLSYNEKMHTLRGMHFQKSPAEEIKIVTCVSGEVFDVVLDLRKDSATYLQWQGFHLSAKNPQCLYIPQGLAHGFLTLQKESILHYQMSENYRPDLAAGVRYNDPRFQIQWPAAKDLTISDKDKNLPDFV